MTPVTRAVVRDTPERLAALALDEADLREAGKIELLDTQPASELSVEVELAPPAES